jgi:hypothetical protein
MNGDYNGWMDVPEAEREALDQAWMAIDARAVNRRRWPRGEYPARRRQDRGVPYSGGPMG